MNYFIYFSIPGNVSSLFFSKIPLFSFYYALLLRISLSIYFKILLLFYFAYLLIFINIFFSLIFYFLLDTQVGLPITNFSLAYIISNLYSHCALYINYLIFIYFFQFVILMCFYYSSHLKYLVYLLTYYILFKSFALFILMLLFLKDFHAVHSFALQLFSSNILFHFVKTFPLGGISYPVQ